MAVYDRIGTTYRRTRRPDPRIDAAVRRTLGDARSVVNVGAGAGSYEPPETVLAVEPSAVMISQRPPGLAPAVRTTAEAIPLADGEVDAALAVLTIHHWPDLARGFAEMRRVARRIVVLTWDPGSATTRICSTFPSSISATGSWPDRRRLRRDGRVPRHPMGRDPVARHR